MSASMSTQDTLSITTLPGYDFEVSLIGLWLSEESLVIL